MLRLTRSKHHRIAVGIVRHQSQRHSRLNLPASPSHDPGHFHPHDQNFAKPTIAAFSVLRRVGKFFFISIFGIGAITFTAYEGAHAWVEHVELANEDDEELRTWGWTQDAERWSGGAGGGTDPALGIRARHAVRSAWISQHWGTHSNIISPGTPSSNRKYDTGGIRTVEAGLEYAHDFLNIALSLALSKGQSKDLHSQTIPQLLARHASILERMGTRSTLFEARSEYERVWASSPNQGLDAARIAWKIGDLCSRLGDGTEATEWWSRAIYLINERRGAVPAEPLLVFPESLPSSPRAQRTLSCVFSSLSAHYAQSGQLKQAQAVEQQGLKLLGTLPEDKTSLSDSPPHKLHQLFLLHRSSLLSIHLGEVQYALQRDPNNSLQLLKSAADASARVALTLSGLPLTQPDALKPGTPHPSSAVAPLLSVYSKSRTMRRPASSLLRDARRSAAEAWNLAGLLNEGDKECGSPEIALECYERALGWAGVPVGSHGVIGRAGESILEKEWQALWSNYVRVREVVKNKEQS